MTLVTTHWSQRRREALASGVLTPDKRARLDAICEHVGRLLDADAAHLTIVLEDVQVYAGDWQLPMGLIEAVGGPWRDNPEFLCVPLEYSFCKYVVQDPHTLLITDATQEAQYRSEKVVTDFGLKSYLGTPVCAPDGVEIGALCALGMREPKPWTADDVRTLERFALLANAVFHTS